MQLKAKPLLIAAALALGVTSTAFAQNTTSGYPSGGGTSTMSTNAGTASGSAAVNSGSGGNVQSAGGTTSINDTTATHDSTSTHKATKSKTKRHASNASTHASGTTSTTSASKAKPQNSDMHRTDEPFRDDTGRIPGANPDNPNAGTTGAPNTTSTR